MHAELVKRGDIWPGFTTYGWRFGEKRTFRRPKWFFDPKSEDNPETVDVVRVRPKGIYPKLSDEELSDKLMELCEKLEVEKRRQMKADNRRFKGLKKLAKTKWNGQPSRDEDRFRIKPRVASSDPQRRIAAIRAQRRPGRPSTRYAAKRSLGGSAPPSRTARIYCAAATTYRSRRALPRAQHISPTGGGLAQLEAARSYWFVRGRSDQPTSQFARQHRRSPNESRIDARPIGMRASPAPKFMDPKLETLGRDSSPRSSATQPGRPRYAIRREAFARGGAPHLPARHVSTAPPLQRTGSRRALPRAQHISPTGGGLAQLEAAPLVLVVRGRSDQPTSQFSPVNTDARRTRAGSTPGPSECAHPPHPKFMDPKLEDPGSGIPPSQVGDPGSGIPTLGPGFPTLRNKEPAPPPTPLPAPAEKTRRTPRCKRSR